MGLLGAYSKVTSKLLVTEKIIVMCPYQDKIYILNRVGDVSFTAHFKGDAKPEGVVKRNWKHWDKNLGVRLWRKSAFEDGNNPLHQAVMQNDTDRVKYFSQFTNMHTPNDKGNHPIHLAFKMNHLDILETMCKVLPKSLKGCDANGNTVLHLACQDDNVKVVKLLIDKGADLNYKNRDGDTPKLLITKRNDPQWNSLLQTAPKLDK